MAIKWFKDNKMIVNLGKFQAITLDKKKNNHTQEIIKIDKNAVKVKSSVKLRGVQIDAELNFNLHIANICRSSASQLYTLIRLGKFLGSGEKKAVINSYFYLNVNYFFFFLSGFSFTNIHNSRDSRGRGRVSI